MFTIENYLGYVNNLKKGKGQLSITKESKKTKIMSTDVDQLQRE